MKFIYKFLPEILLAQLIEGTSKYISAQSKILKFILNPKFKQSLNSKDSWAELAAGESNQVTNRNVYPINLK